LTALIGEQKVPRGRWLGMELASTGVGFPPANVPQKNQGPPKFCFTSEKTPLSLGPTLTRFDDQTVSQPPTRKTFLAQLLGLFAVVGLAPKLPAKLVPAAGAPVLPPAPFAIRPEARAVAREV
jgi:hypothetical protein